MLCCDNLAYSTLPNIATLVKFRLGGRTDWNNNLPVEIYKLQVKIYKLRVEIYKLQVVIYKLQIEIYKLHDIMY